MGDAESSKSPRPAILERLEAWEAKKRSRATEANTSETSPSSAIDGSVIPNFLHRSSPIPLSDQITGLQLAHDLGTHVSRVQALLNHGYLRVLTKAETVEETVVARPAPAAFAWLKQMFMPLRMRPMLPVDEVSGLLKLLPSELRAWCLEFDIALQIDPVFGELISLSNFYLVMTRLQEDRSGHVRFDSQRMLTQFLYWRGLPRPKHTHMTKYSKQLEMEIKRILAMQEPERSIRATNFYLAYIEARNAADCMTKFYTNLLEEEAKPGKAEERIAFMVYRLKASMQGRLPWKIPKSMPPNWRAKAKLD